MTTREGEESYSLKLFHSFKKKMRKNLELHQKLHAAPGLHQASGTE